MIKSLTNTLHKYLHDDIPRLKSLPAPAFFAVYFMTWSVLIQGILDVGIKIAGFTPWFVTFPWRVDFLFLTAVSVLMGYQTLIGIKRRELDVTRNSVQIGLLVETALVIGDTIFIIQNQETLPEAFPVRGPFIIFTLINICILIYLIKKLELLKNKDGNWQIF